MQTNLLIELTRLYTEPHRRYHDLRHVADMLCKGVALNLSDEQVYGLDLLLDLSDDELFALIMGRKELKDVDPAEHMMDENDMRQADEVLALLRVV